MKRKALRTKTLLAFYRRFPPIDLRRSLKHEERTAMNSRILERRVTTLEAAQKDASGTRRGPEAAFRVDLRPGFQWPQVEVARTEGDDRRRSIGVERGENRILGGSDPTLSGFGSRPTPSAPGVATAQVVQQTSSLRRRPSCRRSSQKV